MGADGSEQRPLISIIVLNYNDKIFVNSCLESVLNSNYSNFEVIFVDNASTDGSSETVRKNFGSDRRIHIVRNSKNLGFASGNNVGLRFARGKYIVFLNVDTLVDPQWLEELSKVMEKDSKVGVAQSKLLSLSDKRKIDCVGGFIDRFGWSHRKGEGEIDIGQYDKVYEIFYAVGAAMAIRRSVLEKVGAFDSKFFIYFEDTDLCWRVRLSGYRIVCVPKSIVFHAVRGTMRKSPLGSLFHGCKNNLAMLTKNYELHNVVRYLPLDVVFVLVAVLFQTARGEVDRGVAYLKAILWNIVNFKYVWSRRLEVQSHIRNLSDKALLSQKELVLGRALFFEETFRQLTGLLQLDC